MAVQQSRSIGLLLLLLLLLTVEFAEKMTEPDGNDIDGDKGNDDDSIDDDVGDGDDDNEDDDNDEDNIDEDGDDGLLTICNEMWLSKGMSEYAESPVCVSVCKKENWERWVERGGSGREGKKKEKGLSL